MPFNFNDEVGDVEAPMEGQTKFGRIGVYAFNFAPKVSDSFVLENVFDDQYDNITKANTRIGPKVFNRHQIDGTDLKKPTLLIVVLETENKDSETYQIVKQCDNILRILEKKDKDGNLEPIIGEDGKPERVNFLKKFQLLQLQAAEGEGAFEALINADTPKKWVWGQATLLDSEVMSPYGTIKYLGNFVVYPDKATMDAASEEFYTPASEREEDTWISHALQDDLEQRYPDWQQLIAMHGLGYLKEQALKYADTAPALLEGKMGMSEELATEIINAAKGIVPKEMPF